jgi:hypothetical protein
MNCFSFAFFIIKSAEDADDNVVAVAIDVDAI